MSKRIAKMESQLERWGEELEGVAVQADDASAQAKLDAKKKMHDLQAKHRAAKAKQKAAKEAGADKWDDFKAGLESSWGELESAFAKLGD